MTSGSSDSETESGWVAKRTCMLLYLWKKTNQTLENYTASSLYGEDYWRAVFQKELLQVLIKYLKLYLELDTQNLLTYSSQRFPLHVCVSFHLKSTTSSLIQILTLNQTLTNSDIKISERD